VVVVALGVEVPLGMMGNVVVSKGVVVSVDVINVFEEVGTVDVEAPGAVGGMLGTLVLLVAVVVLASELFNVGVVEVELTNGGALSTYEPLERTA
jgi:hypothetical protein